MTQLLDPHGPPTSLLTRIDVAKLPSLAALTVLVQKKHVRALWARHSRTVTCSPLPKRAPDTLTIWASCTPRDGLTRTDAPCLDAADEPAGDDERLDDAPERP